MTTVDKITGAILVLAIVVVGALAAFKDINGEAALGFISGITVALLTHTTAQVAVNKQDIKQLQNTVTNPPADTPPPGM